MRELRGKRVLITGGARGIGRALASAFARQGAVILLVDTDEAALDEAVRELRSDGADASAHAADVTDHAGLQRLHHTLHAADGPIDVLVNNAGVVHGGAFLEVPLARHETTYAVNTVGLVAMTHVFLPDLLSRPEGHLVNIASASGFVGLPYGSTYASSKWAVIGFSESIRLELSQLGHRHVRVTTVCPSYVTTELFRGARPPKATRFLQPDRLAGLVVAAVKRDRVMVLAPFSVRVLLTVSGLLPRGVVDALARLLGMTTSMQGWKGRS